MDEVTEVLEEVQEDAQEEVQQEIVETPAEDVLSVASVAQITGVDFPSWVGSLLDYPLRRPYSYVMPSEVVQIAKDCVAGYSGEYFLFQYDADEWVLVLPDSLTVGESVLDCDGFSAYDIQYVQNSATVQNDISGNLVGFEEGAAAEHFSGSYEVTEARPSFYRLYYDEFEESELHVSTSEHAIIYASVKGYASLHDASAHYDFASVLLLSGMIVFYFINSIFKKVK